MAAGPLTDPQNCADFFTTAVLTILTYWQNEPAVRSLETEKLDQEMEGLMRAISFGLTVDDAWPVVSQLIEKLSPYMERRGYWAAWEQVLEQALDLAKRRDDTAKGVIFSLLLARLLQRQSKIKQTIRHYRQTLYFARRCDDQYNEARACTNMGFLFIEQGRWLRSEVLCRYALAIFEQIGSQHGLAHTENHLGFLYLRQQCWRCAQQHLERACQIWLTIGDEHGLMRGCINLSALYLEMKSPIQAKYYLIQALQRAKDTGEEVETAAVYVGMAVACRLEGDPLTAERYARQAETIFRRFHHLVGIAQTQDNLGLVCLDQGKWQDAEKYFNTALQQWHYLKSDLGQLRALTYLIEYELARQNRRKAATRFSQVEKMLNKRQDSVHYYFLQRKLNFYRHSLSQL